MVVLGCFLLEPAKCFLTKMERKLRKRVIWYMDKNALNCFLGQCWLFYFILFIFCFLGTLCLFFSLGCGLTVIWFDFFFFFVKLDVIFFSWHYYYFLINLGDFFFLCLSNFCFDWTSFFNKCMWVNLCKLFFFFPSIHFFTLNQTKRREIKIFFILSLFHQSIIFYPSTFSPLWPNRPLNST